MNSVCKKLQAAIISATNCKPDAACIAIEKIGEILAVELSLPAAEELADVLTRADSHQQQSLDYVHDVLTSAGVNIFPYQGVELLKTLSASLDRLLKDEPSSLLPLVDCLCNLLASTEMSPYAADVLLDLSLAHTTYLVQCAAHNSAFKSLVMSESKSKVMLQLATFLAVHAPSLCTALALPDCTALLQDYFDANEDISPSVFNLILAVNNAFFIPADNLLLEALKQAEHGISDLVLAEVISHFNRLTDPLLPFCNDKKKKHTSNSVVKFLVDVFSSHTTSQLVYTNDTKVIYDVILRYMSNSSLGSQEFVDVLSLLELTAKNSNFLPTTRYKLDEIRARLSELSSETDFIEEVLISKAILIQIDSL